ncbi:MAG TPA: tripartite tricarboxylate transporter TctB family protein [Streptomyces sp.]|uniref:tripartite tricarboxylate transporter TctB family protein n=1 Tax=Streptomyces sp. TaxID=1931 RepID=UPI002D2B09BE|nr:tripartite tricarboxylate transporter TctB family protein [Streptomyces sp.]HZG02698.1 tripartite tricarboxylate transporter TctB family protein [Streptomyces sp.]
MEDTGADRRAAGDGRAADAAPNRAELLVCALLALLGAVVLFDALTMADLPGAETDPIGPRAVPVAVGAGLLALAVALAVDVLRGGRGEAEGGEDIDLAAKLDWRAVLLVIAFFLANAALIEPLGWAVSGAVLFWGTAWALGSRRWLRDAAVSVTLSVGSFYAFAYGLGIILPPGVLKGIL